MQHNLAKYFITQHIYQKQQTIQIHFSSDHNILLLVTQ